MDMTEAMLRTVAQEVLGKASFEYQGVQLDFGAPFQRLTIPQAIAQHVPNVGAALHDETALREYVKKLGTEPGANWGLGRLQMEIFEQKVEHLLLQPTFITEYPTEVSPLARRNDQNPAVTDRFELFIGGHHRLQSQSLGLRCGLRMLHAHGRHVEAHHVPALARQVQGIPPHTHAHVQSASSGKRAGHVHQELLGGGVEVCARGVDRVVELGLVVGGDEANRSVRGVGGAPVAHELGTVAVEQAGPVVGVRLRLLPRAELGQQRRAFASLLCALHSAAASATCRTSVHMTESLADQLSRRGV